MAFPISISPVPRSHLRKNSTLSNNPPQDHDWSVRMGPLRTSLEIKILFASALKFASAMMTSGLSSTPNAWLIAVEIRFACLSDQNRKSSGSRTCSSKSCPCEVELAISSRWGLDLGVSSLQDNGMSDGSESRQSGTICMSVLRTESKSRSSGFLTMHDPERPQMILW